MRFLCSICVRREADTLDDIDGKRRPVCKVCTDEPVPDVRLVDEDSPKHLALRAIRMNPGATFIEIREWLGIPGGGCNKHRNRGHTDDSRNANRYCKAVERLVKDGLVERTGEWPEWQYWPVRAERRRAA